MLNLITLGAPIFLDYLKKKHADKISEPVKDLADAVLDEASKKSLEQKTTQLNKVIKK